MHSSLCTTKDDACRIVEVARKSKTSSIDLGKLFFSGVTKLAGNVELLIVLRANFVVQEVVVEGPQDLASVLNSMRRIAIVSRIP